MNRKIRCIMKRILICLCIVIISGVSMTAQAKTYYSYNNVGLNYGRTGAFYGKGKNGYKWVVATSVKGKKLKYRLAKFTYSDDVGHDIIKPYGKTYTAKLTSSTKYYKSAPWARLSSLKAYNYSYHSKKFKNLSILVKAKKSEILGSYYQTGSFYMKIKNGKVKCVISPVIFAM